MLKKIFKPRFIPNYLSLLRLLLVPLYVYLFFCVSKPLAAAVLILCALTDALDGYLARRMGWVTDIGKLLDPLADKLASIGALVCLSIAALLPWWITALAIGKELVMILAAAFLLGKRNIVVFSVWYGKLATVLFYVVVLALHFFSEMAYPIKLTLWLVLFVSMAGAAIGYLIHYLKDLLCKSTQAKEDE